MEWGAILTVLCWILRNLLNPLPLPPEYGLCILRTASKVIRSFPDFLISIKLSTFEEWHPIINLEVKQS